MFGRRVTKQSVFLVLLGVCVLLIILYSIHPKDPYTALKKMAKPYFFNATQIPANITFRAALQLVAPPSNIVIISIVDYSYYKMLLNFYELSIRKHNIHNFLPICIDRDAEQTLRGLGVDCYLYNGDLVDPSVSSEYGAEAFAAKVNIKTRVLLDALNLGYTVLLSDVDVIFVKNPLPYFSCDVCDIHIQDNSNTNGIERNSGFIFARPTNATLTLFQRAWDIAQVQKPLRQQEAVNLALSSMLKLRQIKVGVLDRNFFQTGRVYFDEGKRIFAGDNPCLECVVIHNNYILGEPGKAYRLKEHLMWSVDIDGYYTDVNGRYLIYDNLLYSGKFGFLQQLEALENALAIGFITNRIVILPKFSECTDCNGTEYCSKLHERCPFDFHFKIGIFDRVFGGRYREHTFLKNPKVPKSIKVSETGSILVQNQLTQASKQLFRNAEHLYVPKNKASGATDVEVKYWFSHFHDDPVLRFHSLYDAFSHFEDHETQKFFDKLIKNGLKFR